MKALSFLFRDVPHASDLTQFRGSGQASSSTNGSGSVEQGGVGFPTLTTWDFVAERDPAYSLGVDVRGLMKSDSAVAAALTTAPAWSGDVDLFVGQLADQRSRPTIVRAIPAMGTLFGAWLPTLSTDFIFLSEHLSGAHRAHVLLHEVGHLLMDHRLGLTENLSGVTPELARRMLARHGHDTEDERQAELFASLVMTGSAQSAAEWTGDPRGIRATKVFG